MKRSARGFAIYTEFLDTYGAAISVHASSAAGVRRVWVSARGGSAVSARQKELAQVVQCSGNELVNDNTSAHLTPAQARRLAKALLRFAGGAE